MNRYLVLTMRTTEFQHAALDAHYAYLQSLRERNVIDMAGPFSDRSGGAYLLRVASIEDAEEIAFKDPLHLTGSSTVRVAEWHAE